MNFDLDVIITLQPLIEEDFNSLKNLNLIKEILEIYDANFELVIKRDNQIGDESKYYSRKLYAHATQNNIEKIIESLKIVVNSDEYSTVMISNDNNYLLFSSASDDIEKQSVLNFLNILSNFTKGQKL